MLNRGRDTASPVHAEQRRERVDGDAPVVFVRVRPSELHLERRFSSNQAPDLSGMQRAVTDVPSSELTGPHD